MKEKYSVGVLAGHACVRVQKMALPLMKRGNKVYMASQKVPSFADSYDLYSQCFCIEQMRNWVQIIDQFVDLYHVHNEPSWFVTLVKEMSSKPVILDVHDSFLTRLTDEQFEAAQDRGEDLLRISVEERNNFQLADGLVFPSKPFGEAIIKEFGLTQPYCILPSYLPQNLLGYQLNKQWEGGIVYEGRVDLKTDVEKDKKFKAGFTYTDYEDFAKQCKALDITFFLYARDDADFVAVYKDIAIINSPVPYPELMVKLSKHDWGLVGNSFYTPEWEIANPNKLWEYVAAGVPVVSMYAKHCSEIIEEHGLGITIRSVKELTERWKEHTEIRKNLLKVRGRFTMENHVHHLEGLYGNVLG